MNKLLFFLIIFTNFSYSQEFDKTEKSVIGIFNTDDKNKAELFSLISKWISINYKSSKHVIQFSDIESGTIIIKGTNIVKVKNALKSLYPNNLPEFNYYELNHLLEINVKDKKFRVIYKVSNIASGVAPNDMFNFDCINFTGVEQNVIDSYDERTDKLLKASLVGKKKRDNLKLGTKEYLNNVNTDIINSAKIIMQSIQNNVVKPDADKW